jgi:Arc/MetJ-type ribon-helix-helix transcriptional regulator
LPHWLSVPALLQWSQELMRMTITITLRDEVARIVERQIADGRYPDAESAVTAALMLLEDAGMNWDDVDVAAVRAMIAESDAEGGEIPLDEVARRLGTRSSSR